MDSAYVIEAVQLFTRVWKIPIKLESNKRDPPRPVSVLFTLCKIMKKAVYTQNVIAASYLIYTLAVWPPTEASTITATVINNRMVIIGAIFIHLQRLLTVNLSIQL